MLDIPYSTLLRAHFKVRSEEDFMRGLFNDAYATFFLVSFIKAYVVVAQLNCLDQQRNSSEDYLMMFF